MKINIVYSIILVVSNNRLYLKNEIFKCLKIIGIY